MKKYLFILMLAVLPLFLSAQVRISADSNYIKIEQSGANTAVLFTKDVKISYSSNTFYFSGNLASTGWEYTIPYANIEYYNTYSRGRVGFPQFSVMRDAIINYIKNGRFAGEYQMMGLNGHYPVITTTATIYIPLGWCVQVVEASVIASLSYRNQTDSLVTITAAAGQCFYGKFKHIKLTSGKVLVYK